jgi:hypothetical protein
LRRTIPISRIEVSWVLAVALAAPALLGCSGRQTTSRPAATPDALTITTTDALADRAPRLPSATPDAEAPDAPVIVTTPPIDVPGVALWLDGDVNVFSEGNDVVGWKDRSASGRSFVVEASGVSRPRHNRNGLYGTVQFYGHERLVALAEQPNAFTRLTIDDQDFLLALVLLVDSSLQRRSIAFGLLPYLAMSPSVTDLGSFSLAFEMNPTTATFLIGGELTEDRSWNLPHWATQGEEGRVVVFASVGDGVQVRINGKLEVDDPKGRLVGMPANTRRLKIGPNAMYVGSWDWDSAGIRGDIGEIVMVVGTGTAASIAPVEGYLRSKYGF